MSKTSILVVEDEAIVAADIARILTGLGYRVAGTTGEAESGVRLARELRPDLVLMDIRLSAEMDGVQAAEIIQAELGLPVVFLTAHSDRATLERAKLTGPFGYILKPFDELGLETHIEMALYKHGAEMRLREANETLERRVEERTRELREAERELREANETLERRVEERTRELGAANALLRNSRLAALNMMEDAVEARRQAEEAMARVTRSEAQLRFVTDHAPIILAHCDCEERFLFVNAPYATRFGLTPADIVGRRIEEVVGERAYAAFAGHVHAALRGERREFEVQVPYESGTAWMFCTYVPDTVDAEVRGFVAVIQDVTRRKEAEEKLQESETRYRELVQNANSAIIRWRADGTLTFFNEYAQALFGYDYREVVGRHVSVLVPESESTGRDLSGLIRGIVEHPERYLRNVNENVCKDGRRIWMAWSNRAICAPDGSVAEILAIGTDITRQKLAEDELRESEERYRSLFLNMTEEVHLWEVERAPDGGILTWRLVDANPPTLQTWGKSIEEIRGKTTDEI
ncbi:MAG TPA: PAS domain S-box protein, partial [Verrucomicrobiae bacterium]|nr:PAS domain S-box protein [Verrucomicrobiae bacterium]